MKTSSWFHKYKEILLGVGMLALAGLYLHQATIIKLRRNVDIKVSAKLIPEILGVLVIILAIAQIVHGVKYLLDVLRVDREEGNKSVLVSVEEKRDIFPILATFILIFLYAMSFEWLGFVISSTLCMFFQMLILSPSGGRRPGLFAFISVVVALVVYVAFRKGLSLSLPQGLLEGVLPV